MKADCRALRRALIRAARALSGYERNRAFNALSRGMSVPKYHQLWKRIYRETSHTTPRSRIREAKL